MNNRSERLRTVQKVNENREQNAAREMGKARDRVDAMEKRLTELMAFREEYAQNLLTTGQAGISIARMREYQLFLTRLDQAIAYQRNSTEQAKTAYAERQRAWGYLHGRVIAMEKLIDRHQQKEQSEISQQEQKEIDEHAQRSGSIAL